MLYLRTMTFFWLQIEVKYYPVQLQGATKGLLTAPFFLNPERLLTQLEIIYDIHFEKGVGLDVHGLSDIELLQAADFSFAMRNAFNSTNANAHYITGSNQENAVLKTIEHILSLQGNRLSHEPS